MEMSPILTGVACLVLWAMVTVSAQEMDKVIYETTLSSGLVPGNLFHTKLYLQPGIEWFRINLQNDPGNPETTPTEAPFTMRVYMDPIETTLSSIERDWHNQLGVGQLPQPEKTITGEFPFYPGSVYDIKLLCMLDYYEFQVNGFEKFRFLHQATTLTLSDFDVIRIMAIPGTVDICWTKFNLDLLPDPTAVSTVNPLCNQEIERSMCDDLVCYLYADDHNMYTSTANPVSITTDSMTLFGDVVVSLELMAEQFCCLEGIMNDLDSRPSNESLQWAADVITELLTWNGNASWHTLNEISQNGPLSLMDRLDDIAQTIGNKLSVGTRITVETPSVTCSLEANTLSNFITADWSFKPFEDKDAAISFKGSDLANLGFESDAKIVVFGAVYNNITHLINNNQKGTVELIVSDVISLTVFGPDGQISVPTSYTQKISKVSHLNGDSNPRYAVCAFWDDRLEGSEAGGWSERGCSRITEDGDAFAEVALGNSITCHCSHTTNYAILMRLVPVDSTAAPNKILSALTVIGCFISILALLLALAFFIFVKHNSLDTERILIHRNLMGGLLVAMVIFLIGDFLVNELIPCQIFAALQHYLYLAVFCWMLVEGVHLYRLIVTVYGSEKQMAKFYYAVGWGLPLVIVGISAAIKWTDYGVPGVACWLNPMNGFIWAFVAPACIIMLVNCVVLGLVINTTVKASVMCSADKLMQAKTGLRSSLVLLPMLGITWTFGVITHVHTFFEYIFVIMNSFQGLWLVMVCCLMNGEVRNAFHLAIKKKLGKFSTTVDTTSSTGTAITYASKQPSKEDEIAKEKSTELAQVD